MKLAEGKIRAEYTDKWMWSQWPTKFLTLEDLKAADCSASMHVATGGIGLPVLKTVREGLGAYLVARASARANLGRGVDG